MKKKAIFLLLLLTGIVPIACCPEPPSGPYQLYFNSVTLLRENYVNNWKLNENYTLSPLDTYDQDTLVMRLGFDYYFAQNISFALHSTALALSCDEDPLYMQLDDQITDINITSDMPFNEVEPGESLNAKVVTFDQNFYSSLPLLEAPALINSLKGYEFIDRELDFLAITEKPIGAYEHTFSIEITYNSGKKELVKTFPMVW